MSVIEMQKCVHCQVWMAPDSPTWRDGQPHLVIPAPPPPKLSDFREYELGQGTTNEPPRNLFGDGSPLYTTITGTTPTGDTNWFTADRTYNDQADLFRGTLR